MAAYEGSEDSVPGRRCLSYADAVWARAAAAPRSEVIRTTDGRRWSALDLRDAAAHQVAALRSSVSRGNVVASCVGAGPGAVAVTAAISALGAVELPVGTEDLALAADRGPVEGRIAAIVATESGLDDARIRDMAARHDAPVLIFEEHPSGSAPHVTPVVLAETDPALIVSTSGTTGRRKAALLPAGAPIAQARRVADALGYQAHDAVYTCFAWHHINARNAAVLPALISGARVVMDPRFSASGFWETARREGVTAFNFLGAMIPMLLAQPPTHEDRAHAVARAYGGPAPAPLARQFRQRFGTALLQAYACTELGDVATTSAADVREGAAGRPVADHEVRIVDEALRVLPDGETGEIVVRPRRPGLALLEYVGDPAATRAAWAGDWFRTRDRGHSEQGWLYVSGRSGDVIRRRGVNIDPHEVESALLQHPGVAEAAAVAVPSPLTEDDVLAVAVLEPGGQTSPVELWRHCRDALPRHAVPRHISIETVLPTTSTHKLDREALRTRGLPVEAWDSEMPDQSRA